jgi:hypothetical protein
MRIKALVVTAVAATALFAGSVSPGSSHSNEAGLTWTNGTTQQTQKAPAGSHQWL